MDSVEATEDSTTSTTYTVALSPLPTAETKVTMSVDDSAVATISPDTLTFTTTDGTTAREVTVTGVSDADPLNETTTILHLVSIGDHEFPTALLPVKVIDDDAPVLTLTHTRFPSDVSEGFNYDAVIELDEGDTETYTVELAAEPPGDVTISLLRSNSAALTVSPSSITFTKTGEAQDADKWEWRDPQTVTLTPVSDSDASDEISTVRHESTIGGKSYVLAQARILVRDLALPRLTFEQQSVTVDEGGTATYTVVPATVPSADLTLLVVSGDEAALTVEPDSLTFTVGTGGNWQTAQEVTITGVSDDDEFDDSADIRHGTRYDGEIYLLGTVSVTVTDGNRAPYFEEGISTTREVPENAGLGTNVGAPVKAIDLNSDTLTYTLDDQSGKFSISSTGQITLAASSSLDYETVQDYSLEVEVSDRAADGLTDKIEVKVLVTDVNEPPVITGEASPTFNENSTGRIERYSATDPEGDPFTWAVSGSEASNFSIDSNGNLSFSVTPDFEDKFSYFVSIVAADDKLLPGYLDVTVAIVDIDEPPTIIGEEALTFAENTETTTTLHTYGANDPEGIITTFTWSLSGADSGDFEISNTGSLTFNNVPDFERPADSGSNNVYNVTVRATDSDNKRGDHPVTVTVTDVNEAPSEPTGRDTITVAENTTSNLSRYSTTDPERATIEWSVTGNDSSAFRIDSSGNLAFDGAPNYEAPTDSDGNNIYDIAITATDDGTLGDRTQSPLGSLPSSFDVTVTVTPVDEPPVITGSTTISDYDENTPATNTVASYTADDPEGDTNITWSLAGADRGDFTITNGELKFASKPDYEHPADSGRDNHYDVTVVATDSNNKRGEQHVDVIVKNVDEPPALTGPDTVDDFPENSSTSLQVARYTATDPERATVTLSLSLGGADFALASNGTVTFKESPDFEDPNGYTFTFTVRAEAGSHTVDRPVTVTIENVEEPGSVSLLSVQPQERTAITATLEDDGNPEGTEWQWYRTSSRGSTGTAFTNATSRSYTPVDDDVGSYLRVVASYDDGHGDDKSAAAVSANRVQEAPPQPEPPVFPVGGDYDRSIRENTRAGTNLGAPVTATDGNNDRLTYTIDDTVNFEINGTTGQLRTKVELDHEVQSIRTITVSATDPGGLRVTVTVTVTVEDVDETPVVSGPTSPEVAENGNTNVATYTSTDPDEKGIEWVLTGTDSGDFTLSGGDLAFNELPNYEEKNQYRVTIEAHEQGDGTSIARLSVTVRVTNVDEPGMVVVPVNEPRVGQQLTPTVVDPDEGVGSIEWKWEHREAGGDWTPIPGGTSRSYTPTRDDNGKELRVTAFYRDRHGPGKTYTHEFVNAVVLRPFFSTDTATRSIEENTPEGRNVGQRFTAQHPDNVNLEYRLEGRDVSFFTIDLGTGQLRTSATSPDYETQPGPEAEVVITATDSNSQTATLTLTITVANVCGADGEEPCAPGRPNVRYDADNDTNLLVSWSAPRSNAEITDYEVRYRLSGSSDNWIQESVSGTDRSHTIVGLTKSTPYQVQVRASNVNVYGEWSQSGTGTPGYVPPPTPPPPPPPPKPPPPKPSTTTGGGGGGGAGGGGFAPPGPSRPPAPARPVSDFQPSEQAFQQPLANGTLVRVWRLIPSSQAWLFYDPRPGFARHNTLGTINLAADPPAVVAINVTRPQAFRNLPLLTGWNIIPVTIQPLPPSPGSGDEPVRQVFEPLIRNGTLERVWWLDSKNQRWVFFDPDPRFLRFNKLENVDLAANPPVVLAVGVKRRTEFRGQTLYRGWNYVVMR